MIINLEIPYFSIKCLSIGTPKAISFPFVQELNPTALRLG